MSNNVSLGIKGISEKFKSPERYVQLWFTLNMYYVTSSGRIRNQDRKRDYVVSYLPMDNLFNDLYFTYQKEYAKEKAFIAEYNKANKTTFTLKAFRETDLEKAFSNHVEYEKINYRVVVRNSLSHLDIASTDILDKFVGAICRYSPDRWEYDLTKSVLMHWLWSVKVKMMFGPSKVVHHLMPILYGKKQGSGKSTAIRRLLGPIEDFTLSAKRLTDIADPREAALFKDNYAVVIEELAGAQKADIEQLKTVITESEVSFRRMRTNFNETVDQNSMFIGTSNKPIEDMIKDSTGMRRFFEIKVKDRLDWESINSIDYTLLWKSIDENLPTGYLDNYLDKLSEYQNIYVQEDPVEYVFQENSIRITAAHMKAMEEMRQSRTKKDIVQSLNSGILPLELVPGKILLQRLKEELTAAGYLRYTKPSIGRKLREFGVEKRTFSSGDYYFLPRGQTLISQIMRS